MEVSRVLQEKFKGISRHFQGCISECFKEISRKFKGFLFVSIILYDCFKEVLRMFQGYFKGVLNVFQG